MDVLLKLFLFISLIYLIISQNLNITNICIDINICLKNLSTNNNKHIERKCFESNTLNIPFNPSRKITQSPKFVVATIYMYSNVQSLYRYINFIRSFASSNRGEILMLVSINNSLISYIRSIKNLYEKSKSVRYKMKEKYYFFKYKESDTYCYLIYTDINQHYFNNSFLMKRHYTNNSKRYSFSGYYAAGTNLYAVLPFLLQIFDYFDYYFKYDFDIPGIINVRNFALSNVKIKQWYLFGTCLIADASYVCSNIKQMLQDYVKIKKCSVNILSSVKYLTNQCIEFPGWFTGMWLGFYGSYEMKEFSNFYMRYKKGIEYYRWGDQQFFLNSVLLFIGKNKINYNLTYGCYFRK